MFGMYSFLVSAAGFFLKIIALFSPKMRLFVDGRKTVFDTISQNISKQEATIWFHAASLGEFEQGLPVMEKIKIRFPKHKIIVTFFSPSGYEIRKNNTIADVTVYLPLDTRKNAKLFIDLVHPELVFFIKYEFWPNYLNELKSRNIKTYLISGIFRENQAFFKWYGGFYRNALKSFEHFFVQNEKSKKLVQQLGFQNVSISGDTRFDRVVSIVERDNRLDFIEEFKNNSLTIVVGSSWPKDEELLVHFINQSPENIKFIIAPHNIKPEQIVELQKSITKKSILYTDLFPAQTLHVTHSAETLHATSLQEYDVFIINTIGILTKIYNYADIAYVGGGFGNPGVHNILEPATFGVPIIIGPNYSHFAEATALVNMEGCISISNQKELNDAFSNLISNDAIRHEKGHICSTFVQMNKGATEVILKYLQNDNV
jgi:3-deoxy-D-manno-octulosonic-acid transferase